VVENAAKRPKSKTRENKSGEKPGEGDLGAMVMLTKMEKKSKNIFVVPKSNVVFVYLYSI
jgi:hypothetical protein